MNPNTEPFTIVDIGAERFGTGLQIPPNLLSSAPEWEESGLGILSRDKLLEFAKNNDTRGSTRFDKSFIKNQRSHGSCQGFMSAGMLTRARIRRGLPRVDLSGAYVYSKCNGGRDRGSTLDDGMQVVLKYGSCSEQTVGWDAIYPSRYDVQKADAEAAEMRAFECYTVREELQLFTALAMGFDCGIAVHADNGFMQFDGRGIARGGNGPGNHAVGVDGYWAVDGELICDMYNSWDLVYGREGRAGVTWSRHLRHTTNYHPFYAIRSTIDGSGQVNPPTPIAA